MNDSGHLLAAMPVPRAFFKLAAPAVAAQLINMLLLLSVLLTGIMLAFGRPILLLFGASTDTISYAADYMNIYCLGTVFTQLTLGLNAFITAQGKTLVGMGNAAIGAAANIVLDAALICGFHLGV